MKGILVINNFVAGEKTLEIARFLKNASENLGISLETKRTGELLHNYDFLRKLECDFVLFWDKDVILAKMLENCGFPVFNSADAIYACDNKAETYLLLGKEGVRVPKTFIAPLTYEGVNYWDIGFAKETAERIGFPMVIKELYGSFGQQVYLAHNMEELEKLIAQLGSKGFLMQEFISGSSGRDVRINVVGDQVVSAMKRFSVTGDFRSNISNGGHMEEYSPSEAQTQMAIKACRALKLDFAGVDVLFGEDDEPIICEVNSNPHFKSSIDCTGIDMSRYIMEYIKEKIKA